MPGGKTAKSLPPQKRKRCLDKNAGANSLFVTFAQSAKTRPQGIRGTPGAPPPHAPPRLADDRDPYERTRRKRAPAGLSARGTPHVDPLEPLFYQKPATALLDIEIKSPRRSAERRGHRKQNAMLFDQAAAKMRPQPATQVYLML